MRSFSIISAFAAVYAASTKLISCNNQTSQAVEMTVQLTNSYMTQYHPELKQHFTLNGDVYERTYTPAELEIDLTNADDIILNLNLPIKQNIIDDLIVYKAGSTSFSCRYLRTVMVNTNTTVTDPETDPHTMYGYLPYAFNALNADNDRTAVVIKPNHGLELETNVKECNIKYEQVPGRAVYPIHSFTDETCLDKRIDSNIYFKKSQDSGKSVEITIDWKTFKFNGGNENKQRINIECKLRAANELSTVTPPACTCFDKSSCADRTTVATTSTTTIATTSKTTTKEKSVLVLSTYKSTNVPMVISFDGSYDDDISFTYGDDTSASYSCGATLNGENWIFGGSKRQWSKVNGCRLDRVGSLPFDFDFGACNTFQFAKEEVLLCFDKKKGQGCHRFDGERFQEASSSSHPHENTSSLAKYMGQPMTTGSYYPDNVKTEIMDLSTGSWSMAPDFPYARRNSYSHYATVSSKQAAFFIGGYIDGSNTDRISQFKNNEWSELGILAGAKRGLGAITLGAETMVVGGFSGLPEVTEVWTLGNGTSRTIEPTLPPNKYVYGFAMFVVDSNFCKKSISPTEP